MDDHERTVRRVRTEETIDDQLATPPQPVVTPPPAVTPAGPVVATPPQAPGPPVATTQPPGPAIATRDRVVTDRAYISERPSTLEMARRVITLLFGILQGLLILRIILLLLIANRDNEIVQFILGVTGPFVSPFADMFALERISNTSGSVLDIGAVVALVGWTLIELLILAILNLGARRSRVETV